VEPQDVITVLMLIIAVLMGVVSGLLSASVSLHFGASRLSSIGTGAGAFATSTALMIAIMTFARS
jgi:hypothetical protein